MIRLLHALFSNRIVLFALTLIVACATASVASSAPATGKGFGYMPTQPIPIEMSVSVYKPMPMDNVNPPTNTPVGGPTNIGRPVEVPPTNIGGGGGTPYDGGPVDSTCVQIDYRWRVSGTGLNIDQVLADLFTGIRIFTRFVEQNEGGPAKKGEPKHGRGSYRTCP